MPITYVVECDQCSGLLLAAIDQKSRTCPFCGTKINLQRAKRLATADNSIIASEILRKIKNERQLNTKKPPVQVEINKIAKAKPRTRPRTRKKTRQSTL